MVAADPFLMDRYTASDPAGLPMPSYGCRFPAMIADWRSKWSQGSLGQTDPEFPFGFVSLAVSPAAVCVSHLSPRGRLTLLLLPALEEPQQLARRRSLGADSRLRPRPQPCHAQGL